MAEAPSADHLIALGLYDPEEVGASDRLPMLQYLFEHGATEDDVRDFDGSGGLGALAAELWLRSPGERLTLGEAAERCGRTEDQLARLWRSLGFPDPLVTEETFAGAELESLVALVGVMEAVLGWDATLQLTRVLGASVSRMAAAEVAALRLNFEAPTRSSGASSIEVADTYSALVSEVLPLLNHSFDALHRRHLVVASRQYWSVDEELQVTSDLAVGFADVVGFTSRSRSLSSAQLVASIGDFEDRVLDVVGSHGGRLVKLIGDEAMFVADSAERMCGILLDLVETFDADEGLPPLRAAAASGAVITMHGDYYGDVVNLASRLVSAARPSSAVVSKSLRDAAPDAFDLSELPPLALKGIGKRVRAWRLRRPDPRPAGARPRGPRQRGRSRP